MTNVSTTHRPAEPSPDRVRVLGSGQPRPPVDVVVGAGTAVAVVWPGVGAEKRSMHLVSLAARAHTRHLRHRSEAVYYVIDGTGQAFDQDGSAAFELGPGSMIHVEPGTGYRFVAGTNGLELVGGPCPADSRLYGDSA